MKKKQKYREYNSRQAKQGEKNRHITTGISQRTSVSANREGRKITQIQKGKGKNSIMLEFYFIVGGIEELTLATNEA